MPKQRISDAEIARLQGAFLSVRESVENLLTEDLGLDDMSKGIIIGVFAGIPAQVRSGLAILSSVTDRPPAPDESNKDA